MLSASSIGSPISPGYALKHKDNLPWCSPAEQSLPSPAAAIVGTPADACCFDHRRLRFYQTLLKRGHCARKATVIFNFVCYYKFSVMGGLIMRRVLLAIIALGNLVGFAQASDLWGQPPVYQVASRWPGLFSWSGFYVGGHAGYGWGTSDATNLGIAPDSQFNISGGVAGGQVGINWQWEPLVLGVEVDFSAKAFKGGDDGAFGTVDEVSGRWGSTARLRLGYALDRWMFFATGGWALLNYHYSSTLTPGLVIAPAGLGIAPGVGIASTNTDNGWVFGGGVEQAFAPNWSAKVEYLHADFGNLATNEIRAGLNYRFVASY
jgi:outer membrane immunogenic protein